MRVMKFGGTSIADANKFICAANIIEKNSYIEQIAVVLSAPAKITNKFVKIINYAIKNINLNYINSIKDNFISIVNDLNKLQNNFNNKKLINFINEEFKKINELLYGISLLRYCPDQTNAIIICYGEKFSVELMKEIFIARDLKIEVINPVEKLLAFGTYLETKIDIVESTKRIKDLKIHKDYIILMAGFIAGNKNGELVTLGRNGSDYSASILSACLNANYCEIWTDVDGIYTCDPNIVSNAKLINVISYQEAMEFSYFGAKILHPNTIRPIAKLKIPCLIKNTNNPENKGTLITSTKEKKYYNSIIGITYLDKITMVNVIGTKNVNMISIMTKIFFVTSKHNINIILTIHSSSKNNISFCISTNDMFNTSKILEKEFYLELKNNLIKPLKMVSNLSIISIINSSLKTNFDLFNKIFLAFSCTRTNIIAVVQGTSKYSISIVIKKNNTISSIRVIHQMLFNTNKIIEIFIIGRIKIINKLVKKINEQFYWLKSKDINIKICGIFNSKISFIDMNGINLDSWNKNINIKTNIKNINNLLFLSKKHNLLNPIIIDYTNNKKITKKYINFLINGFHIITSNNTISKFSMNYYNRINNVLKFSCKKFIYNNIFEINYPITLNLNNLINTKDELISFYGILSGPSSFIFGKLDTGISLYESIVLAKKYGYSEMEIKKDLLGLNIAKKLLIIARNLGFKLEFKDIDIEPVLPMGLNIKMNIEEIFKKFSKLNKEFSNKIEKINFKKQVLRYVGIIKNGLYKIRIKIIKENNPLFKIKNGENILVFFTHYYKLSPLILSGCSIKHDDINFHIFNDILQTLN